MNEEILGHIGLIDTVAHHHFLEILKISTID